MSRIGARPRYVCGWSVGGWHRAIEQTQIDGQLRSVMRAVKHPAPEDPDPFTLHVEEVCRLQPVGFAYRTQPCQPWSGELDKLVCVRSDSRLRGQDLRCI